jgi:diadenosine tetraphosphate (Ap4A) HIT family hydrolase
VSESQQLENRIKNAAVVEGHCIFCDRVAKNVDLLVTDELCVAFYDTTPLNPGHALIIPRRHEPDFLMLSQRELSAICRMATKLRVLLDKQFHPDGFNVGANVDDAGGQTIGHAHLHLIPRYKGDVPDPKGGIRCLIPERMRYWTDDKEGDPSDGVG